MHTHTHTENKKNCRAMGLGKSKNVPEVTHPHSNMSPFSGVQPNLTGTCPILNSKSFNKPSCLPKQPVLHCSDMKQANTACPRWHPAHQSFPCCSSFRKTWMKSSTSRNPPRNTKVGMWWLTPIILAFEWWNSRIAMNSKPAWIA